MLIEIRLERPGDRARVRDVNLQAFGQPNEADLVDALRSGARCASLVAVDGAEVVGHILFSPVTITGPSHRTRVAGLGPMAVLPSHQRQGIGSRLVRVGLEECTRQGYEAVVVVGHPPFYPRFGFVRGSQRGLRYEHPVPDEAFMVIELRPGALGDGGGVVKYLPEFDAV